MKQKRNLLTRKRVCVFCIILIAVIPFVALLIHIIFSKKEFSHVLKETQLWSHRGLGEPCTENSLCAFESALNKGAQGIEIDVFFDSKKNVFIVSHEPPTQTQDYPQLEAYFSRFKDSTFYWLDLKNLSNNNVADIEKTISIFDEKYQIRKKIFVESSNAKALNTLSLSGINTLYWVQFNRKNYFIRNAKITLVKYYLSRYGFKGISTSAFYYDQEFKKNFKQVPTFIFHPRDTPEINSLRKESNINVILTDGFFE